MMKRLVSVVLAAIMILALTGCGGSTKREDYIKGLEDAKAAMLVGGSEAEKLGNLVASVWHDSIYKEYAIDTYKYTHGDSGYYDDFNDALRALYSDTDTVATIAGIDKSVELAADAMKAIQNPPDEFKECYEAADSMYEAFLKLVELVKSPNGSYNTFTSDFHDYDTDLSLYFKKLDTLIPAE